jgi:hypothetical protein
MQAQQEGIAGADAAGPTARADKQVASRALLNGSVKADRVVEGNRATATLGHPDIHYRAAVSRSECLLADRPVAGSQVPATWVESWPAPTLQPVDIVMLDNLCSHKTGRPRLPSRSAEHSSCSCRPAAPSSTRSRWSLQNPKRNCAGSTLAASMLDLHRGRGLCARLVARRSTMPLQAEVAAKLRCYKSFSRCSAGLERLCLTFFKLCQSGRRRRLKCRTACCDDNPFRGSFYPCARVRTY